MKQVNLGMIGGGTVGSGVFNALKENAELMAARTGVRLVVRKVAVKAFDEPRAYPIDRKLMTTDWKDVVNDPEIQIVTELVGGTGIAKTIVLAALESGKSVVTANKALVSAHGPELFAAAKKAGSNLYYEASVAGGIPIIKTLREALVGDRFERIYGIVNGTCNYILTRMTREGAAFADVLADAQRLGYAEADPTLDVDGHDAAHKTGILASLAHGFWVDHHEIHTEGIRQITPLDIRFAQQLGYAVKLLGSVLVAPAAAKGKTKAKKTAPEPTRISVAVAPTLVPESHVLASVNDVFNAVFVSGFPIGDTLYYGRGAGKDATASAVLGDLADAALDLAHESVGRVPAFAPCAKGKVVPFGETSSRFYVRLNVVDKPGVIAKVSAILSQAGISIASIVQPEGHEGETVPLILMTHCAKRAAMDKALATIGKLPTVKGPSLLLPVEDFA